MKKQCIVIITNGFPYGDSERSFFSKEYERLCENNCVILVALNPNHEMIKYPTAENEKKIRLTTNSISVKSRLKSLLKPAVIYEIIYEVFKNHIKVRDSLLSTTLDYSKAEIVSLCLKKLEKNYSIKLIYTYWCTYATYAAVQYKKRNSKIAVISRFHGYDLFPERTSHGFFPFRARVLKGLDYLIFACEAGKQYIDTTYSCQFEPKSIVRYIGANKINFRYLPDNQKDRICILSCSNIIELKRIDRIIDALSELSSSYFVSWIHIGDGPLKDKITVYANDRLKNKPNIEYQFIGFVENNKLSELINKYTPSLFITTSTSEGGAPVTIQEMFSAGIPAIGTRIGGIPEMIIDGVTGYLVDLNASPNEICEAIVKFIKLPNNEKMNMSRNALKLWREKLNVEDNSIRFSKWIETVMKE